MIIRTVLSRGRWEQVEWLFDQFGTEKIRQVFLNDYSGLQSLPESTRNLWQLIFVENPPNTHLRWVPDLRWVPGPVG